MYIYKCYISYKNVIYIYIYIYHIYTIIYMRLGSKQNMSEFFGEISGAMYFLTEDPIQLINPFKSINFKFWLVPT